MSPRTQREWVELRPSPGPSELSLALGGHLGEPSGDGDSKRFEIGLWVRAPREAPPAQAWRLIASSVATAASTVSSEHPGKPDRRRLGPSTSSSRLAMAWAGLRASNAYAARNGSPAHAVVSVPVNTSGPRNTARKKTARPRRPHLDRVVDLGQREAAEKSRSFRSGVRFALDRPRPMTSEATRFRQLTPRREVVTVVSEQLEGELCEDTLVLCRLAYLEVVAVVRRASGQGDGFLISECVRPRVATASGASSSAVERLREGRRPRLSKTRWQRDDEPVCPRGQNDGRLCSSARCRRSG